MQGGRVYPEGRDRFLRAIYNAPAGKDQEGCLLLAIGFLSGGEDSEPTANSQQPMAFQGTEAPCRRVMQAVLDGPVFDPFRPHLDTRERPSLRA